MCVCVCVCLCVCLYVRVCHRNDRTKSLGSKTPSTDLLTTPTTTTTTTSQDLAPAPAPLPDSDSSTGHSEPTTNTHDNKPYYKAGDLSRDSGVSVASSQAISEAPSVAGSVATSASGAARKRQGASTGRRYACRLCTCGFLAEVSFEPPSVFTSGYESVQRIAEGTCVCVCVCVCACRCLGSLCTFIVSGLWHELVFAQMTGGHTTRGVWTAFFVIQVRALAIQGSLSAKTQTRHNFDMRADQDRHVTAGSRLVFSLCVCVCVCVCVCAGASHHPRDCDSRLDEQAQAACAKVRPWLLSTSIAHVLRTCVMPGALQAYQGEPLPRARMYST